MSNALLTDLEKFGDFMKLPWKDPSYIGKGVAIIVSLLVLYYITYLFLKTFNNTIHEAPFYAFKCFFLCIMVNLILWLFMLWYMAVICSIIISLAFSFIYRNDLLAADNNEKNGMWGLRKKDRIRRGEEFSALSEEKQIKFKNEFKEKGPNYIIFYAVTIIVPFLIILAIDLFTNNYIFFA